MATSLKGKEFFHYVPVSERDVQWGLYVTGAGWGDWRANDPYPHLRHPDVYDYPWRKGRILPEYQLVFITRGEGMFESGPTGTKPFNAGSVLVTPPGVWHRYRPNTETGWEEYWVSMNGEQLHRLQRQGIISADKYILQLHDCDELQGLFDDFVGRVRREPGRTHTIAAQALEILASSYELETQPLPQRTVPMQSAEDAVVSEAMQFIWDHSQRPMTIDDVVSKFPVSRRSLERRFRKATGRSLWQEITRCRLQRAKQLLGETKVSVSNIAQKSGFSSTDQMHGAFRQYEGISPWAYRRKYRQP